MPERGASDPVTVRSSVVFPMPLAAEEGDALGPDDLERHGRSVLERHVGQPQDPAPAGDH